MEGLKCLHTVVPNADDVVNEASPETWTGAQCASFGFPFGHIDIGKRTAEGAAHRRSLQLEVLVFVEGEAVSGEEDAEHGEQGGVRPLRIGEFKKGPGHGFNTFLDGNVVVQIRHIHREEE